jgi:catechol 2,3-dioxygenase-like lactoylglutathione lyase family enzyme
MKLTSIEVISVPVSDQDRARDFYVNTLGFKLQADERFGPDQRWVQVGLEGTQPSVTLVTWFESMPAGSLRGVVLGTDDVDAAYKELSARGVSFEGPIEEAPWGRFATFSDPDGNGWVLQQSRQSRRM